MHKYLVTWIGHADLRAPEGSGDTGVGPVAQALSARRFDRACVLADYRHETVRPYRRWLQKRTDGVQFEWHYEVLPGPTHFGSIYRAAVRACTGALATAGTEASLTFHLSPGTPAMAAVWIILAKTRFPAELIESSVQHGVRTASVPFDISADYLPDLLRRPDEELARLSTGLPSAAPEFEGIVHRGPAMKRLIARARRVAPRSVPLLIEGETGTGKELLARAVHRASPRRDKPFIPVNCGAIPSELVETELFGHEKGAFTGAVARRDGHFVEASQGTLFLDEVAELSKPAQVKLLRALQEGEVLPVGSSRPRRVDVRLIAATHRSLLSEVTTDAFREDLFHRIAVAVLRVPPLRNRREDLSLLIDHLLSLVNRDSREQPGYVDKKISVGARNILLAHPWPGNVRELQNTLIRAAIWTPGDVLTADDIHDALLPVSGRVEENEVLGRPLGEGLDLSAILAQVARHYLQRALDETGGNKTRAAKLVGLSSYQTFTNWTKRYGLHR